VLALKRVPLFAGIPGDVLASIALLAEEVRFRAGETMIRQGEPGDCLYVTVDGQTGITISGAGQVAVRDAPTVLGEMAIILRRPRSAGCVALTDVLALKIDHAPFQELLAQAPEVALEVIKVLAERLDEAQQMTQEQS
jgi:CRP-like cAMP-binding protein